jgi:hypothetical protein
MVFGSREDVHQDMIMGAAVGSLERLDNSGEQRLFEYVTRRELHGVPLGHGKRVP